VDRKVMDSVMRTHAFVGVTHEFVPGTEVIAYLAPHEARRLFGGANATPHTHLPADTVAHVDLPADALPHTHLPASAN
jgi:urease accessory protein